MEKSAFPGVRFCLLLIVAFLALATGARALTITAVTSDNGYPAHKVQWTDAAGQPRTAVLVDQNSTAPGPYTGYLRQYTYQINGQPRVCTGSFNYANGNNLEFSGDGFVQNHTAGGGDFSTGNGKGTPGTTAITLQGTHHATITYNIPTYKISGQTVPTTVQWFFADGRSHPVFAVSQDARATTGNLGADSNTPYGDMAYDGDGVDALVGGFSYGDTYKLVTLAANPEQVTKQSPWRATEANTIPYTMQWAEPATADAEMGHVATLPISVSDQGQDTQTSAFNTPPNLFDPRAKSRPNGPLPNANTWAYQIINYTLPAQGPTDSKRLAWGSNFGRVGGFNNYGDTSLNATQYSQHSTDPLNAPLTGARADGLLAAYSTFIVLGPHAGSYLNGTVGQTVAQGQAAAASTLAATVGAVVTSGPAGVGNAASAAVPYVPAGYNPTYATWEINAAQNSVDATLTLPNGGFLDHPVFVVNGYTAPQLTAVISVNGQSTPGVSYFATLDPASQRLWITVNQAVTSAVRLVVVAPTGTGPVITNPTSTSAQVGVPFGFALTATNLPTSYAAVGLPPGLNLDPATGLIAGTPTTAGTYTASISATNASGTGTAALTFTVSLPPANIQAINILSPPANIKVVLGETIDLEVAVEAVPGTFAGAAFDADNTSTGEQEFLGSTTATRDRVTWRPTALGDYLLDASATDINGAGYDAKIPIHVVSGGHPPVSVLLSGLDGKSFAAGSAVQLVGIGVDANGVPLPNVQILVNGKPVTTLVPSAARAVRSGTHRQDDPVSSFVQRTLFLGSLIQDLLLTVITTDANGVTSVSGGHTIHVAAPLGGDALSCAITGPTEGSTLSTTVPTVATVAATRASGSVKQVEFFVNNQSVGTTATAPFEFGVSLPNAGSYALTAIATDDQGTSKTADPVIVNAVALPVVTVVTAGDGLAIEGGQKGKIFVQRTGGTGAPLTVSYKAKGSAKGGVDYKPLPGTVTIPAGASKAKIKIKPIDNQTHDGTRKAKIKLLPASDGSYFLGDEVLAKVKVIDND